MVSGGDATMEERVEVMTDKQWEGILIMVRCMIAKCQTIEEALETIDAVLEGKQKLPKAP